MEIKTCEQYVLEELQTCREENEELTETVASLFNSCTNLKEELSVLRKFIKNYCDIRELQSGNGYAVSTEYLYAHTNYATEEENKMFDTIKSILDSTGEKV